MKPIVLASMATALLVCACATQRQTEGTAVGAVGGALVGGPVGAVVGGAAGAAVTSPTGPLGTHKCYYRDWQGYRHWRWC